MSRKKKPASCEAGFAFSGQRLKNELRAQLQDAGQVSTTNFKETGTAEGARGSGPLVVIEDVKCLRAELERRALLDGEVLKEGHVEIRAVGVTQEVTTDVTEREASRGDESIGIVPILHIRIRCDRARWRDVLLGIADQVRIRSCANAVSNTGIIAERGTIGYVKRHASRKRNNAGPLPTAESCVQST